MELADERAALDDALGERAMLGRIDDVDAAAEHRDGDAAAFERAAMRRGIDAARHAADDGDLAAREIGAQPARHFEARTATRARDPTMATDGRAQDVDVASDPERLWRIVDGGEGGGISGRRPWILQKCSCSRLLQSRSASRCLTCSIL